MLLLPNEKNDNDDDDWYCSCCFCCCCWPIAGGRPCRMPFPITFPLPPKDDGINDKDMVVENIRRQHYYCCCCCCTPLSKTMRYFDFNSQLILLNAADTDGLALIVLSSLCIGLLLLLLSLLLLLLFLLLLLWMSLSEIDRIDPSRIKIVPPAAIPPKAWDLHPQSNNGCSPFFVYVLGSVPHCCLSLIQEKSDAFDLLISLLMYSSSLCGFVALLFTRVIANKTF